MRRNHSAIALFALASCLIASSVRAQDQHVVFIHGIISSGATWNETAARLEQELQIQKHQPSTNWILGFHTQTEELDSKPDITPIADDAIAIGHSNGGVIARTWGRSRNLRNVVSMGSPHDGAPLVQNGPQWVNYVAQLPGLVQNFFQYVADLDYQYAQGGDYASWVDSLTGSLLTQGTQPTQGYGTVFLGSTGFWVAVEKPVTFEMLPHSPFFQDLNDPANVAVEHAKYPEQVTIASVFPPTPGFTYPPLGGPLYLALSRDSADTAGIAIKFASIGLHTVAFFYFNDPTNPDEFGVGSRLHNIASWLGDWNWQWCWAVSDPVANRMSQCSYNDIAVPIESQLSSPGYRLFMESVHTKETKEGHDVLFEALRQHSNIPPRNLCAVWSASGAAVSAGGGQASVQVNTEGACQWTALSTVPWISISSGSAGQGPSSLSVSVAANPDGYARSGGVVINGVVATIAQAGTGSSTCIGELDKYEFAASPAGGTSNIQLTTAGSCTWTASSSASWLTPQPASGTGSTTIQITISPAASGTRVGIVTIAGRSLRIVQNTAGTRTSLRKTLDFDGDGRSDIAYYDPSSSAFWMVRSNDGLGYPYYWGIGAASIPVPGDYDGDGKTDVAYYFPTTTYWWVVRSSDGQAWNYAWGSVGAIPVPGDYDGDGRTDVAYYHPSTGYWYVVYSSTGQSWSHYWGGQVGLIPVPADYDGDGKTDIAYYQPSTFTWAGVSSQTGQGWTYTWGVAGAIPVPGYYDSDAKADVAYYFPLTSTWWYVKTTTGQSVNYTWGSGSLTTPMPADYDGDGKTDFAYFAPYSGTWGIVSSSTGQSSSAVWGAPTVTPLSTLISRRPTSARSSETALRKILDFDGDGKSDIGYYHRQSGGWWYVKSSDGVGTSTIWGPANGTVISVPGDYDGDGRTDVAYYDPATTKWWGVSSLTGQSWNYAWGSPGAVLVPGDYDGDGKTDFAYYYPPTGTWFIVRSSDGVGYTYAWGYSGTQVFPVPADYDGDGITDLAFYNPATTIWSIVSSRTRAGYEVTWGSAGAVPTPGDYDGDGKADVAYYFPITGTWWVVRSSDNSSYSYAWGAYSMAQAAPADYDGDGRTDMTYFYRPTGTWLGVSSLSLSGWTSVWGGADSYALTVGRAIATTQTVTWSGTTSGSQNLAFNATLPFTTPGTYSFTVDAPFSITFKGTGGGAGGGPGSVGGGAPGGSGGGAGATTWDTIVSLVPGKTYTLTVGAGGAGGHIGYNDATAGGATVLTTDAGATVLASLNGGGRGVWCCAGGAGGTVVYATHGVTGGTGGTSTGAGAGVSATNGAGGGGAGGYWNNNDDESAGGTGGSGAVVGGGGGPLGVNGVSKSGAGGAHGYNGLDSEGIWRVGGGGGGGGGGMKFGFPNEATNGYGGGGGGGGGFGEWAGNGGAGGNGIAILIVISQ